MWRTVLIYGGLLAAGAFGLQWLQYHMLVRAHPAEVYFALFALACMALGGWVTLRLMRRSPAGSVAADPATSKRLKISDRELEVLALIAAGKFQQGNSAPSRGLSQHRQDPCHATVREAGRQTPHPGHPPRPRAGRYPLNHPFLRLP